MNKTIITPPYSQFDSRETESSNKWIKHEESKVIDSLRWICVISVVMLHSGVFHLASPEQASCVKNIHAVFTMIPSLQILFILSGYLFFNGYGENVSFTWSDYCTKCRKRIKTLLIPYFLWCLIGLLFGLFVTHEYSHDYSPGRIISLFIGDGICGHPCGRAMWYVRSLIVFCVLSPVYFYFIRFFQHLTPILAIICIINEFIMIDNALFSPYILLGGYLSYFHLSLYKIATYFFKEWKLVCLVFVALSIFNIYFIPFENMSFIVGTLGLFCIMKKFPLNAKIVKTSTFIYFSHMYIAGGTRNFIVQYIPDSFLGYVVAEWITFGLTLTVCLLLYYCLSKYSKYFLAVLTGSRC